MKYSYNLSGIDFPIIQEFPIASTTVIEIGEVVKLLEGLVVSASTTEQGSILGVAAEAHNGTGGITQEREKGTKIRIYCAPLTVYEAKAQEFTASGGSGTTVVLNGTVSLGVYANDDFNGGYLQLSEKGTTSTLTDPVGTVYAITDFVGSSKTFTGVFPGGASSGDKFILYPPLTFVKGNLNSSSTEMDYSTATGRVFKVVAFDTNRKCLFVVPATHQLQNSPKISETVADISTANGTDLATTQALANATKTKVNDILSALRTAGIMKN